MGQCLHRIILCAHKHEWLNRFTIRDEKRAHILVFECLEIFHDTVRIHSHCDYMPPNEFKRLYWQFN
jgi:hypothetical protein